MAFAIAQVLDPASMLVARSLEHAGKQIAMCMLRRSFFNSLAQRLLFCQLPEIAAGQEGLEQKTVCFDLKTRL